MDKHLVVLDLGTQSVRAAVVSSDGAVIGVAQVAHEVDSPYPGWAQQQPDRWWAETCMALRSVLGHTGVSSESIAGFCCCGQMHGPVGLDDSGRVTTSWTQLWCDKRCQVQCDEAMRVHGEAALAAVTANPPHSGWMGFKVRWIRDQQPDVYARTRWFLAPKDFINFRLTGVAATDPSEASGTFLWDAGRNAYSPDVARALGIDLDRFAPAVKASAVIGTIHAHAASETALPAGLPVVAGCGDFMASLLGIGVVQADDAAELTGTSTLLAVCRPDPIIAPEVSNLRHAVDAWIPFTQIDSGGLSMKWCQDLVGSMRGAQIPYDELIALAADAPPGCDGLLFYPYLIGERRRENAGARGGFFGLTPQHRAAHMVRAVMEGVAFAVARNIEIFRRNGVEIQRVRCAGGGTRNALWNQIKADVYGLPLDIADDPEAGIKGAALLAAAGAGIIRDVSAAALARRVSRATLPQNPENHALYRERLVEFTRVYDHMLGFWTP